MIPHARIKASVIVLLLLAIVGGLVWLLPGRASIRHVVLISIDTCRADRLGCYGYPRDTTPRIDALAGQGFLFRNALAHVPLTLPSHSSMLTGTIPPTHGVHDNLRFRLGSANVTLAEWLQERGYATAAVIGSYVLDRRFGLNQGFDHYDDDMGESAVEGHAAERRGSKISRLAIDWLEHHHDEPFFLFLHFFDPHRHYVPPEPFRSTFADDPYAAEIAYADKCIGQVIDKLKQLGIDDETLVVVTSDHGEMLGEHGEQTHGYFIYDSSVRVPLIFRPPNRRGAAVIEEQAALIDIVPTICGLLGIEAPPDVQGIDLSGFFAGRDVPAMDRPLYCESLTPTKYDANALTGVVHGRWKYIQATRAELYDLENDPGESNNLVEQEQQRTRLMQAHLRRVLDTQQRVTDGGMAADEEARRRLESLGYVSGGASGADLKFDQSKDDPKDLIDFHRANTQVLDLIHEGKLSDAAEACALLIEKRPGFATGHLQLARIGTDRDDTAAAVVHLRRALELKPDDAYAHHHLGLALAGQDRLDEAVGHYRRALEIEPEHAEAHDGLGTALFALEKIEEAIEHHRRALALRPQFTAARENLGNALSALGRHEDAIDLFRAALKNDPDVPEAHFNLGLAFETQGRPDDAIRCYRRALKIRADYPEAHYNLGMALAARGRADKAIEHYRLALRARPDYAEAHNNLGNALARGGRLDEAVIHFRQAVRIKPDLAEALNNLAHALAKKGRLDEAIETYRRAVGARADYAQAHAGLGALLMVRGRLDRALTHFQEAHRLQPDRPMTLNGLAWILATHPVADVRRPQEAVDLARRAAQMTRSRNPAILDALAAALAATGQFDEAVKTAQAALEQAEAAGVRDLADKIRRRLGGYRQGRPHVETVRE